MVGRTLLAALLLLAACERAEPPATAPSGETPRVAQPAEAREKAVVQPAPLEPAQPGEPGGLPDDRTPLAEGPIDPRSEQDAGQVVQRFFALLEAGRSDEVRGLLNPGAVLPPLLTSAREVHANIGAPGRAEGAAGSLYVEVPVQVYGRGADGAAIDRRGTAVLRRVNDVPGSTPAQRRWHIERIQI